MTYTPNDRLKREGGIATLACRLQRLTLEEEIRIDPEGLLAYTKLDVVPVIEKKKLKGGRKEAAQALN